MYMTFHKLNERQSFAIAVRDDGVTVRVPGYGPIDPLPHDLAHVVVEQELKISRGFWGSVAAGAMFGGMTWISGRRKPHATETAAAVVKANGRQVGAAELVVGLYVEALHVVISPRRSDVADRIASLYGPGAVDELDPDKAKVDRLWQRLHTVAEEWRAVPVGGSLAMEWKFSLTRDGEPRRQPHRSTPRRQRSFAPAPTVGIGA